MKSNKSIVQSTVSDWFLLLSEMTIDVENHGVKEETNVSKVIFTMLSSNSYLLIPRCNFVRDKKKVDVK